MKSKPWHTLAGNIARCGYCGGVSQWVHGVMVHSGLTGEPKPLDYWRWWKRFKQHHAHPEADLDGPWFQAKF